MGNALRNLDFCITWSAFTKTQYYQPPSTSSAILTLYFSFMHLIIVLMEQLRIIVYNLKIRWFGQKNIDLGGCYMLKS